LEKTARKSSIKKTDALVIDRGAREHPEVNNLEYYSSHG
jgi:hypothetical protein